MNEKKPPTSRKPYENPLIDRFRERSSWILIALGAVVVLAFFSWWVQREETETYSLAPGLTTPAVQTQAGRSIPTDRMAPDPRRPTPLGHDGEVASVIGAETDLPSANLAELLAQPVTEVSGEEVHVRGSVLEVIGPNVLVIGIDNQDDGLIVFYRPEDVRGVAPALGQDVSVYGSLTPIHAASIRQWLGARYTDMEPRLDQWEGRLSIVPVQAH